MSTKQSKLRDASAYTEKRWLKHYDFGAPDEINSPRQPIHQILDLAALQFGDRPVVAFRNAVTGTACEIVDLKTGEREPAVGEAGYTVPTFIEFIENLPKSAIGKVLRSEVQDAEATRRDAQ